MNCFRCSTTENLSVKYRTASGPRYICRNCRNSTRKKPLRVSSPPIVNPEWLKRSKASLESGLNSLLYLDAIIALPCLMLYGFTEKSVYMAIVWLLVAFTLIIYGIAFSIDRNFLRSEKHVKEMKQHRISGRFA